MVWAFLNVADQERRAAQARRIAEAKQCSANNGVPAHKPLAGPNEQVTLARLSEITRFRSFLRQPLTDQAQQR